MNKSDLKQIIITGCPRSGTGYASMFFKANGFYVGHEQFGTDGISSWCLAAGNRDSVWGPPYTAAKQQYPKAIIFHQVRNPVDCISSMMTLTDDSFFFLQPYIGFANSMPKAVKCMMIWLQWNIMAEKISAATYRVENMLEYFKGFKDFPDKKYNSREKDVLTAEHLQELSPWLWQSIAYKAGMYGYEI